MLVSVLLNQSATSSHFVTYKTLLDTVNFAIEIPLHDSKSSLITEVEYPVIDYCATRLMNDVLGVAQSS